MGDHSVDEPVLHFFGFKLVACFLIFTAFPAGFMPFLAAGAYRGMRHEQQVTTKWRNPARIESGQRVLALTLLLSAAAGALQALMTRLAWKKWDARLLGVRGATWFVLLWAAFFVGVVLGIWIYAVAPE